MCNFEAATSFPFIWLTARAFKTGKSQNVCTNKITTIITSR